MRQSATPEQMKVMQDEPKKGGLSKPND